MQVKAVLDPMLGFDDDGRMMYSIIKDIVCKNLFLIRNGKFHIHIGIIFIAFGWLLIMKPRAYELYEYSMYKIESKIFKEKMKNAKMNFEKGELISAKESYSEALNLGRLALYDAREAMEGLANVYLAMGDLEEGRALADFVALMDLAKGELNWPPFRPDIQFMEEIREYPQGNNARFE